MAYLVYGDESGQEHTGKGASAHYVFSLLLVPEETWRESFEHLKNFRRWAHDTYGLRLREELHAVDLVAGRGDLGPRPILKWERSRIFHRHLVAIEELSQYGCLCINACVTKHNANWLWGVERALNRLNTTVAVRGARAVLILDHGKDHIIRTLARRMMVHNPVPSHFGGHYNAPLTRLVGDPLFADSQHDFFLQAVDTVAFALLKQEEDPTPNIRRYGIHSMFGVLDQVLCREASPRDPQGIVRVK